MNLRNRLDKRTLMEVGWLLLVVAAAAFLYHNLGYVHAPGKLPDQIGPELWPRAILVLLALLAGVKTLFMVLPWGKLADDDSYAANMEKEDTPEPVRSRKVLGIAILALFGFALSIEILGFPIGCFLFLAAFTFIGKWCHTVSVLIISLLGTLGIIFLFSKLIYLPLPRGKFFFEDLTLQLLKLLGIF
jgi:hypothetical protein